LGFGPQALRVRGDDESIFIINHFKPSNINTMWISNGKSCSYCISFFFNIFYQKKFWKIRAVFVKNKFKSWLSLEVKTSKLFETPVSLNN